MPNGNTLICYGADGVFFEVTPGKEIVWKMLNPVDRFAAGGSPGGREGRHSVFRVTRYAKDYPGLTGRTLTTSSK